MRDQDTIKLVRWVMSHENGLLDGVILWGESFAEHMIPVAGICI